jgi:hypothetical protein
MTSTVSPVRLQGRGSKGGEPEAFDKARWAMKYEATIHFEVKDENIDLTGLITDQAIDVHGVGLIGRTDEGEVASEMGMMWGGVVDWTPEAKVKIAQATNEIGRRLEVDDETANRLWEGMSDVYELMAAQGMCAFPGGEQSVKVIPEALEYIRAQRGCSA